eukprot:TRINITY_DN64_c1_g2_i1.p1 TRINITY_DN64_c1_g2~~TRINITY_DN64_c1_g2_i1.p1  ORF type:complete len:965 (+),score=272.99 TRINITY_DN64_c1_g2_i1:68-2962(+)
MRKVLVALCAGLGVCQASPLADALNGMTFLNEGVWTSKDTVVVYEQPSLYLEPENISTTDFAWASRGSNPTMFSGQFNSSCSAATPVMTGYDLPGSDSVQIPGATADQCREACCNDFTCMAWVFAASAPGNFHSCKDKEPCCYLKNSVPSKRSNTAMQYGTVTRLPLPDSASPPVGIRSAPPLGGLATGTMELRGDGTLTAWTTENNSPAGSAKLSKQKMAAFGASVRQAGSSWTRLLQTHPSQSFTQGVDSLTFGGSPPVTRLQTKADTVDISLFGYGRMTSGNMTRSHHPAVAFSMMFKNNGAGTQTVSAFFNLPAFAENTQRHGEVYNTTAAATPEQCQQLCNFDTRCLTWNHAAGQCAMQKDVPLYAFEDGTSSGTKASWSKAGSGITVNKAVSGPTAGNYTLQATGGEVTVGTGDFQDLWAQFQANGKLDNTVAANGGHGAIAVNTDVAAGETVVLTVVLGYYFPSHNYLSQSLGNYYTMYVKDSNDAALTLANDLLPTLKDIAAIHDPVLKSTLPVWMRDTLIGTLHHVRSAMWFHDGRWRQWEAYDCVNVDSVHNDGERHIPYIMLFPEATKSKIIGWGKAQAANGMIQEQLACGCMAGIDSGFEHGCGRIMSDCSTMYIIYLLELLKWNDDTAFVKEWYPVAKKAAEWQISVSTVSGMPYKLQTTYDILALNRYDASTYSTVFHIAAMRAMAELAQFMGDSDAPKYTAAGDAALHGLDSLMWDEELGAYIAYTGGKAVMADSFYGQVLAHSVGLGHVVNTTRLGKHLDTEGRTNYDAYGLKILTGRESGNTETEQDVWMMAPADHGSLRLAIGHGTVEQAMEVVSRPYLRLTQGLNDLWNAAGILRGNYTQFPGSNYLSSHYGYYMTVWHTMLRLSGQDINRHTGTVSFAPVETTGDFTLPVFLPSLVGTLARSGQQAKLCVTTGSLQWTTLKLWGKTYQTTAHQLSDGACVAWTL